ncbi:MAG: hypothetical protein ACI8WT_002518 [Clostridium sp.]|jgi:hypothetical protein
MSISSHTPCLEHIGDHVEVCPLSSELLNSIQLVIFSPCTFVLLVFAFSTIPYPLILQLTFECGYRLVTNTVSLETLPISDFLSPRNIIQLFINRTFAIVEPLLYFTAIIRLFMNSTMMITTINPRNPKKIFFIILFISISPHT